MKKEQGAVVDRRGNAIGAISVTIYDHGTQNLSTIYSDNGVTPQANPFQTDAMGRWAFYVANGRYDIQFSGSMINTFKLEDVLIEEGGGGVTDHGALTGLGDDDHTQYFLCDGTRNASKIVITDGADHYLQLPQLTTAQRDALTPINGMIIYNSTTAQFERYQNGAWGAFAGGSHAASHQDGGEDEINVAGLSGVLADKQDANKIQGHTVDETAIGDDKILVYKTTGDKFIYEAKGTPSAHAATHQDGGGDEINVGGLSGELADPQPPKTHASSHQDAGADEINVGGLSGELADEQKSNFLKLSDTPSAYTGQGGKVVGVKSAEDGLEFISGGGGSAYAVFVFTVPGDAAPGSNVAPSLVVPYSCTILKAYAYARTAPTGAALIFDVNKNATTIWTTQGNRLQIAAGSNSGTQTNFDVMGLVEGDRLDLDVDQIGSSTPGADITVELKVQLS
jgi:hypothetical protein